MKAPAVVIADPRVIVGPDGAVIGIGQSAALCAIDYPQVWIDGVEVSSVRRVNVEQRFGMGQVPFLVLVDAEFIKYEITTDSLTLKPKEKS